MIKPTLCVHHHPCADGFTAAWAIWKRFGDSVKFHPGVHGQPPPDVVGQHVVIVDFSYPADVLVEMAKQAASLLVLDHHETAQKDLAGMPPACATWESHAEDAARFAHVKPLARLGVQFDMRRSGARMAWDYFHPHKDVPKLVQHVEDRDLWQFKLIGTRQIQSWVFSHNYDFGTWDELANVLDREDGWRSAFDQGSALDRKMQKDLSELIPETKREMVIGGHRVPVVNLPYTMASEAAGLLAQDAVFAAAYYDRADGARVFSLRARKGDFNVGDLAKQLGKRFGTSGGGHAAAAGFRAPLGWEGEV